MLKYEMRPVPGKPFHYEAFDSVTGEPVNLGQVIANKFETNEVKKTVIKK